MAEATRYKTLENNQNRFQDILDGLQKTQKEMEGKIEANAQKFEEIVSGMEAKILAYMQKMTHKEKEPEVLESHHNGDHRPLLQTPIFKNKENLTPPFLIGDRGHRYVGPPMPRIELPSFNGKRPREWIRKCHKYFTVYQVQDGQRMEVVEMFLEGKAEIWYHRTKLAKGHLGWEEFCNLVNKRFGDRMGQDEVEEFNKLQQKGTIIEYQERFEELRSLLLIKNPRLTKPYFISSFISGLKEEIKPMVRLLKPTNLLEAFEIALIQEQSVEMGQKRQYKNMVRTEGSKPSLSTYGNKSNSSWENEKLKTTEIMGVMRIKYY